METTRLLRVGFSYSLVCCFLLQGICSRDMNIIGCRVCFRDQDSAQSDSVLWGLGLVSGSGVGIRCSLRCKVLSVAFKCR